MDDLGFAVVLAAAVAAGTPLVLAGLGELLTQRAGVLNLGVEGMMLMGAVTTFLVGHATGNLTLAFAMGMCAGAALASVHALVSITLRANQIVSGLALVILGSGIASFIGRPIEGEALGLRFDSIRLPLLADIPVVGTVLFEHNIVVYGSWLAIALAEVYLRMTKAGLTHRAVGESPATADTMGVRVMSVQWLTTLVGGLFSGAAGAYVIVALVPNWAQASTTSGIGWIAIALAFFSAWQPWRLLLGAYLFGVGLRANFALQAAGVTGVPPELLSMLPYLLTITVLLLLSTPRARRRFGAPAALGVPYVRSER